MPKKPARTDAVPASAPATDLKYVLYENCVQSAAWQMRYLPLFHEKFTGKVPTSMREDFCGTGRIACEWVKKSPRHRAVGLDLDPEPLDYARRVNRERLPPDARKRVEFLRQDVLVPTREKFDVIGAHNFSFFVFHERCDVLKYARAAYASLKPKGTFFLELAGGQGFITPESDSQAIAVPGVGKVEYVWEQHPFDPVTKVADYSIHFRLPKSARRTASRAAGVRGSGARGLGDARGWMNDAFTYHWRLWEIRETREILKQAGFRDTKVLWPTDETMTEYREVEQGDDADVWLAYVVGIR